MATDEMELRGAAKKEAFFREAEKKVTDFSFKVPDVEAREMQEELVSIGT